MKWVHLDEHYGWMPGEANDEAHRHVRKTFRDHYAYIPDELFNKFNAAWAEVDRLAAEVDKYKVEEKL